MIDMIRIKKMNVLLGILLSLVAGVSLTLAFVIPSGAIFFVLFLVVAVALVLLSMYVLKIFDKGREAEIDE